MESEIASHLLQYGGPGLIILVLMYVIRYRENWHDSRETELRNENRSLRDRIEELHEKRMAEQREGLQREHDTADTLRQLTIVLQARQQELLRLPPG